MQVSPRRCSGFTMVEMLLVAGIILILIAILLPAMSGTRERARLVICASNLSEIGKATHRYIADSFYQMPSLINYAELYGDSMVCPNDEKPFLFMGNLLGLEKDIPMSIGMNKEFFAYNKSFNHIQRPSQFTLYWDGQPAPGAGADRNVYDLDKDALVPIIHIPPGNYDGRHRKEVNVPATDTHLIQHGCFIGTISANWDNVHGFDQQTFIPRHSVTYDAGNALHADGHVNYYTELSDDNFFGNKYANTLP